MPQEFEGIIKQRKRVATSEPIISPIIVNRAPAETASGPSKDAPIVEISLDVDDESDRNPQSNQTKNSDDGGIQNPESDDGQKNCPNPVVDDQTSPNESLDPQPSKGSENDENVSESCAAPPTSSSTSADDAVIGGKGLQVDESRGQNLSNDSSPDETKPVTNVANDLDSMNSMDMSDPSEEVAEETKADVEVSDATACDAADSLTASCSVDSFTINGTTAEPSGATVNSTPPARSYSAEDDSTEIPNSGHSDPFQPDCYAGVNGNSGGDVDKDNEEESRVCDLYLTRADESGSLTNRPASELSGVSATESSRPTPENCEASEKNPCFKYRRHFENLEKLSPIEVLGLFRRFVTALFVYKVSENKRVAEDRVCSSHVISLCHIKIN